MIEPTKAQDWGEPWTASFPEADGTAKVWFCDGDLAATFEENLGLGVTDGEAADRAVACVNAMAGISDPLAYVKAADALSVMAVTSYPRDEALREGIELARLIEGAYSGPEHVGEVLCDLRSIKDRWRDWRAKIESALASTGEGGAAHRGPAGGYHQESEGVL